MSSEQAKVIQGVVETKGTVAALLDADAAGFRGRNEICAKLAGAITVVQASIPLGAQPTGPFCSATRGNYAGGEACRDYRLRKRRADLDLIAGFPCLAPLRLTPAEWDAERLDEISLTFSGGERDAGRFILAVWAVWDPHKTWKTGPSCLVKERLNSTNQTESRVASASLAGSLKRLTATGGGPSKKNLKKT